MHARLRCGCPPPPPPPTCRQGQRAGAGGGATQAHAQGRGRVGRGVSDDEPDQRQGGTGGVDGGVGRGQRRRAHRQRRRHAPVARGGADPLQGERECVLSGHATKHSRAQASQRAFMPPAALQSALSMGPGSAVAAGKAKARLQRLGSNMSEVGARQSQCSLTAPRQCSVLPPVAGKHGPRGHRPTLHARTSLPRRLRSTWTCPCCSSCSCCLAPA